MVCWYIPPCGVLVSSELNAGSDVTAVNGAGMVGLYHATHNLGAGMWLSKASREKVRYHASTHEGVAWYLCEFGGQDGKPAKIDNIQIWNYNQNEHTRRGLNKIFIEYSVDGEKWSLLKDGDKDYHLIPESVGRNPSPADWSLDVNGLRARFVCITIAADGEGNHYDRSNPVIMQEAADMHQNVDYYGFSEIRFNVKRLVSDKQLPAIKEVAVVPGQGYLKSVNGPTREFLLKLSAPLYAGAKVECKLPGKSWTMEIPASAAGIDRYVGHFPAGYMEEEVEMNMTFSSKQGVVEEVCPVPAARKWTVAFFPHSHLDIGYTHRQDDVMKLHWRNMERALDLAERTKDYPQGARYCWNTEATWAVAGYLKEYAGTPKAERLKQAIRDGVINVDMSLGSILTGISRQEELMHMFDDAHAISEEIGVELNTAMMSDVPGQAWGLATAMAQNGVKYYSPGPNYVPFYGRIGNDRAGALHVRWGDRPFYWQSQSGTDKVLVWQAGRGYSWFHGWLANRIGVCGLEPIWAYLTELESERFPYNTCYLRYTVHGDNGPPDQAMSDVIKAWNEKYDSPQFTISTAKAFFTDFEEKYGEQLPVFGGDMTPTWEDGAASTARETAMNRESAARLSQTETLWTMLKGTLDYPASLFREAWKNVLLFSEHTWGASASGPDPHSKFTKELWEGKKLYADNADRQSKELFAKAVAPIQSEGNYIHVINTNLWNRTDVVMLDAATDLTGKVLVDEAGNECPVQALSDGRWAFTAKNIPALSSAVYTIREAKRKKKVQPAPASMVAAPNKLANAWVELEIDPVRGTITSLKQKGTDYQYCSGNGLNDYMYSNRMSTENKTVERIKRITVLEDGPVLATFRIESDAPGCNSLWRDVTVYRDLQRVDLCNTLDKQDILEFENVRFVFPFNIQHPEITMDLAMSEIHPEREQLEGVNKHYYSLQNGLAVGDLEYAVCLTTIDAPFVELGSPSGIDYRLNTRHGYGWWQSAQLSPVVYSWVMTNTWRTNYKASQGGMAQFRYSLQLCNPLDLNLKQRGAEQEHKLLAVTSARPDRVEQLFRLKGNHRIAVSSIRPSDDGKAFILSLHNMDKQSVRTAFEWGTMNPRKVSVCNYKQEAVEAFCADDFWLKPYEYLRLRIEL